LPAVAENLFGFAGNPFQIAASAKHIQIAWASTQTSVTGNSAFVGNPISTATGSKFQVETDYRGSGAYPLVFRRFHNTPTLFAQSQAASSNIGIQWRHSYDRTVVYFPPTSSTPASVTVARP